MGCC